MTAFIHPLIGQVVGKEADKCTQFLGIKYATLKDRFAAAELVSHDGSGIDATKYGPQVISPEQGVDIELGFIQQTLPKPDFPGISEIDGLNLNITVPGSVTVDTQPTKGLPVVVFIHGGGFNIGGNWWPQYDFARLVRLSAELGKPMIGVGINYRVGALGFLTSPELRAAGYKPNNGLRDQQTALRWIKENVSGFGGNPEDVTVMGQSAGAVSAGYLLLSEEKLARQLICLGGCPPLMGTLPMDAADQAAKSAIALLGLQDTSSTEMVERLLELPVHDLFAKMTSAVPFQPTVDGDIIPRPFTFDTFALETAQMKSRQWIERVLLVYSKLDASIMAYGGLLPRKSGIAAAFRASAVKSLQDHPEALASLLDQYALGTSTLTGTDDEALVNILRLMSDISFFLPAVDFADKFTNKALVAAFNEPNPWAGLFKSHASHILDVAFLFQNFNASLDEGQRAIAVTFGGDVIAYVNGETPWQGKDRAGERGIGVYADGKRRGPGEEGTQQEMHDRRVILGLARDANGPGLDALVRVVTDFMSG
ncbi:Alpha/Beta hydrolase protein [Podospora appendiculata]|uniref:Carboxylic ester hydrolase n=1 Tax=Podospora appendiculata TaxID=314037 RepID=A0AAE1C7A5_9PEZI|nr:Alpha/Beta hydrolase protein [Podospora appendiculata]